MTDSPGNGLGTLNQPNVLFICTDQQRADHNGFMGTTL